MTKEGQSKAGAPAKRRGQQMGDARSNRDQNREAMADTPALRGNRKEESEFFADDSAQHMGANAARPRSNTPSIPAAAPTGQPLGESGGEKVFKQRQKSKK